jgi:hypothetical protein
MPKPIKIRAGGANIDLILIGDPKKNHPYISVSGWDWNGYIADKDIRRLMQWCQKCLTFKKESGE